ncbi:MAG TPA: response regulator [Tepidisphaeraceae bacterium]|nr:response regulator [Tepidisphaeraceae bacterium]
MASAAIQNQVKAAVPPRVLIVDDEPEMLETISQVVGDKMDCRLLVAGTVADARKILATQSISLLVADVNLPDGSGMTLLRSLQKHQPTASAIIMTGTPDMDGAITAMREGALDFMPKPFNSDQLLECVRKALVCQSRISKQEKRIQRLQRAVRRLNEARRQVSQKVDLLCNDLINAYSELSKQLDGVRTQEGFRKYIGNAKDLEQLLCHAMDWMLRQLGYCNVAVWLASEEGDFQLGAYMKYTVAGETVVTEALKRVILPAAQREGVLHAPSNGLVSQFSPAEYQHLRDNDILAVNCTYLGEALATVIFFRDSKSTFTSDDETLVRAISPIFAVSLASVVRDSTTDEGDTALYDEERDRDRDEKPRKDPADWWKTGGDPPF